MSGAVNGLPVAGYGPQTKDAVAYVNAHKATEERILRHMDQMAKLPDLFDQSWLTIARTQIEQGFMALNRSVFRPGRVALAEDTE